LARTAVAVTASKPEPQTLTLDMLLSRLFPAVSTRDLLRLSTVSPGGRLHEWFFWRRNGSGWRTPIGVPAMAGDRLETIIAANADTEVRVSPALYSAQTASSAVKLTALWSLLKVAPRSTPRTIYGQQVDPTSEREVLDRLHSLRLPPAITITEGFQVCALWPLREPITDLVRAERVLATLARKLGGDLEAADVRHMTFGVPGQPQPGIFPTKPISATLLSASSIALDDLS
jgi:hypothetical protein